LQIEYNVPILDIIHARPRLIGRVQALVNVLGQFHHLLAFEVLGVSACFALSLAELDQVTIGVIGSVPNDGDVVLVQR